MKTLLCISILFTETTKHFVFCDMHSHHYVITFAISRYGRPPKAKINMLGNYSRQGKQVHMEISIIKQAIDYALE